MIQQEEFDRLAAAGATRIALVREVFSDLDTPLSVYLKLADGPNAYLFESVEGGERWGRHSIIGLPARRSYRFDQGQMRTFEDGVEVAAEPCTDPFGMAETLAQRFKVAAPAGAPKFLGGMVGYFGFAAIAAIEPRLAGRSKPDPIGMDEAVLLESTEVAVFDNLAHKLFLVVLVDPAEPHARLRGERRLDQLVHRLRQAGGGYPDVLQPAHLVEDDFRSSLPRDAFIEAVERCREYIRAGDVFQVVLSQRLTVPYTARSIDVYRALRSLNPSPYLYFIDLGESQIIGSSPEILVRVEAGEVIVRPIAGTRPRGKDAADDERLEAELLADPKERAEHLMLIDLGRNDVGRVAEPGTVRTGEQFIIERYSHVMHIVSEVRGRLRAGLGAADVLRAAFPAGTVSGAPKIRALEIIDELEPQQRGVYAGAVGWLGWDGSLDTAIAIRTAVIRNGELHVQAGAGIVHDSNAEAEWEETMNKGRALFRAVARAAAGL